MPIFPSYGFAIATSMSKPTHFCEQGAIGPTRAAVESTQRSCRWLCGGIS